MRVFAFLLVGLSCFLGRHAVAGTQPRGNVLELHSCELYAGGCIVSSEATLGGRYMLRAWNFTGGSFQGTDLAGLNLAVLQSSEDNLATPRSHAGSVVVYLPANATSAQQDAMIGWLRSSQADLDPATRFQTRVVPMEFNKSSAGYGFSAGAFVSVSSAPLESCTSGACGEALWYTPRATTSLFTVAVDRSSTVREPLLKLTWDDAGRRAIFLGKFGEDTPAQNLFVSSAEICSPAGKLF